MMNIGELIMGSVRCCSVGGRCLVVGMVFFGLVNWYNRVGYVV